MGLVDYTPLRDVPWSEMPGVIASADIVLDQFALGGYGVAAVEAMASGRAVVGHVRTRGAGARAGGDRTGTCPWSRAGRQRSPTC